MGKTGKERCDDKVQKFREEMKAYLPKGEAQRIRQVIKSGKGSFYSDITGKSYLDFSSGIFTNTFGHGDPELARIVGEYYLNLANIHGRHWEGEAQFYRELFRYLPSEDYRVVSYGDGGGYTIDRMEVELYYYFGKKPYQLAVFEGGFHGKTQGTKLSVSKTENSAYFHSTVIPEPNCYRCPYGEEQGNCKLRCAELTIRKLAECKTDVFLFEPILGSGVIIPPEGYWSRVVAFCQEQGILMIADEVLVGGGRTGSYIASTQFGIEPDGIALTKGLANGMPQSVMLLKRKIAENTYAMRAQNYLSTFMGVPALLALSAAVLEKIEKEQILENVCARGAQLKSGLEKIKSKYPEIVGDVRCIGLLAAVEFVEDSQSKKPDRKFGETVFLQAEKNGLELIAGGHILRIGPPLNISKEEIWLGLERLEKSIGEALCEKK